MKPRNYTLILIVIAALIAGGAITIYKLRNPDGGTYEQPETPAAFDQSHAAFDRVLKAHIRDAYVDYAAIKEDPADLDAFLAEAAAVKESTYGTWTENQKLAFLIDLYNAATIRLVIDHYPLASIKDIGNAVVTAWKKPVVRLFGRNRTLDHIEHDLIRGEFDEPRIHFALVCAAVSCPPLRGEAFVPDKLDAQLDDQGRVFLAGGSKNRIDQKSKTVHLSKIFDWFSADFTKGEKPLLEALSPWFSESDRQLIEGGGFEIQFLKYDWSLNDTARARVVVPSK